MYSIKKNSVFYILPVMFFIQTNYTISQVLINEYSCANLKSISDDYGKYEDWIELYNSSGSTVNIGGFYLSDKSNKPRKWMIPTGTTIPANGFLTFWASGRNVYSGSNYHTNFKLSQTKMPGEKIIFSNPDGIKLDSSLITQNQLSHSTGRTMDGAPTWCVFKIPTYKASNNTSTGYRYAAKPSLGIEPGFYSSTINVSLSTTETGATIRYTLNGSEPSSSSFIYSSPISISTKKVLKAKVFSSSPNVLPSFMEYGTYFINVNHSLVVVSIAADSLTELADGNDLIIPFGTFEYFGKDKLLKTRSYGEFNKHGKDSWVCDQRAVDFVSRDEGGYNYALQEKIFSTSTRTEFQRVILRASGDDNYPCGHNTDNEGSSHMRDGYIHNLADRGNLHLDVRRSERLVVYLNGAYWGVYELRENPDDHDYTNYYYKQDKYNLQYLLTWAGTWAQYGGNQALADWQTLYNFILNNDMSVQTNYAYVDSQLNVKSLVDYYIVNSFTVCSDWLNYNTGWWRGLNPLGKHKKWGYILWDNDATFAFYINYTLIPDTSASAEPCGALTDTWVQDPEGHLTILNRLNANAGFHQYYVNRQADLLNTTFSCDTMLNYLDQYTALIEPEMTQHSTRWYGTYAEWKMNVARLRNFIERRCGGVETGMLNCYNLTGPYELTITKTPASSGTVKLNSIDIPSFPWTGKFYGGINNTLMANVSSTDSMTFDKWTSAYHTFSPTATDTNVVIALTKADTVVALFKRLPTSIDSKQNDISVSLYPNVVTNGTTLEYYLPNASKVTIELYDASGKKITQLIPSLSYTTPGKYSVTLDLSRKNLTPGIYLMKFNSGDYQKNFKIIYL